MSASCRAAKHRTSSAPPQLLCQAPHLLSSSAALRAYTPCNTSPHLLTTAPPPKLGRKVRSLRTSYAPPMCGVSGAQYISYRYIYIYRCALRYIYIYRCALRSCRHLTDIYTYIGSLDIRCMEPINVFIYEYIYI